MTQSYILKLRLSLKRLMGRISLIVVFLHIIMNGGAAQAVPGELKEPDVAAETAILMEMKTGEVLYGQDEHRSMEPASTTKILTALLFIENTSMREHITVSQNAYGTRGSSIYLEAGEVINARDLLYGVMINSANDGSVAMAEHVAGNVDYFSNLMNQRAAQLGAQNTHFTNPHGLPDQDHVTTAYDLGMITREALTNLEFRRAVTKTQLTIPWPAGEEDERQLINRNQLLDNYKGAMGVKTGYTSQAGHTFVAAAERDSLGLIAVVLNSPRNRLYEDAKQLLDYGFDNYKMKEIIHSNEVVKTTEIANGRDVLKVETREAIEFPVAVSASNALEKDISMEDLEAPIEAGTRVGQLNVSINREAITAVSLYAKNDVMLTAWSQWGLHLVLGVVFLGLVFIGGVKIVSDRSKKSASPMKYQRRQGNSKYSKYRERRF